MCLDCNQNIPVGATGSDGWSPVLALYTGVCGEITVTVQQLVSWLPGTGTRPSYNGNIMTDAWLADHPIYLGTTGFVTDICGAVPLNGAGGGTGAEGPQGPAGVAGDPGCDPNISMTATVDGGEFSPYPVTIVDGGTTCDPTYDLSFPIETFTDPVVIDAIINSEAFQTYLETYFSTLTGGINGINTSPTIGKAGTGEHDVLFDNAVSPGVGNPFLRFTLNTTNYIKWNIFGNRMTLDFLLNISNVNSPNIKDISLQIKIPASKTVDSTPYPESNSFALTIQSDPSGMYPQILSDNSGMFGTPVITTFAAPQGTNYLLLGVTPNQGTPTSSNYLDGFQFFNPEDQFSYRLQGQLTFTINTSI